MAAAESCSSSSIAEVSKPVIVRVKRKAFQSPIDAFWLEINERPLKRSFLDFGKLSISDSTNTNNKGVEEELLKINKILVRHVETVTSSHHTYDVLRSFVPNSSSEALESKQKNDGGRRNVKTTNKQDQLLGKAKQKQEVLSRNARFEQIWRSRKGEKEAPEDEAVYDMCRLYDVVRVDDVEDHEEVEMQKKKKREMELEEEEYKMMAQYLPLLGEVLPTAATEIENDIQHYMSKQASSDGYVYDFYAVNEDASVMEDDSATLFPSVQVDDEDDFYDGPDDSEYETDDSNAENNPLNEYPDEEELTSESTSDSDEKSEGDSSKNSDDSSEEMETGSQLFCDDDSESREWYDNADRFCEDEFYCDGNEDEFVDEE